MNRSRTVLVVDDKPPARRLVYHALHGRYRVLEAGDLTTALSLIGKEAVGLVLLDLHMPPSNGSPREGIRAHQRIRAQRPDLPVVIVSSDTDPRLRDLLLRQGVTGVLSKPVDGSELVNVVEKLLGK